MIPHGNLTRRPCGVTRPHQGNGLNLPTSSPVLKPSVRRPSGDKARHMRPPAFMVGRNSGAIAVIEGATIAPRAKPPSAGPHQPPLQRASAVVGVTTASAALVVARVGGYRDC